MCLNTQKVGKESVSIRHYKAMQIFSASTFFKQQIKKTVHCCCSFSFLFLGFGGFVLIKPFQLTEHKNKKIKLLSFVCVSVCFFFVISFLPYFKWNIKAHTIYYTKRIWKMEISFSKGCKHKNHYNTMHTQYSSY